MPAFSITLTATRDSHVNGKGTSGNKTDEGHHRVTMLPRKAGVRTGGQVKGALEGSPQNRVAHETAQPQRTADGPWALSKTQVPASGTAGYFRLHRGW